MTLATHVWLCSISAASFNVSVHHLGKGCFIPLSLLGGKPYFRPTFHDWILPMYCLKSLSLPPSTLQEKKRLGGFLMCFKTWGVISELSRPGPLRSLRKGSGTTVFQFVCSWYLHVVAEVGAFLLKSWSQSVAFCIGCMTGTSDLLLLFYSHWLHSFIPKRAATYCSFEVKCTQTTNLQIAGLPFFCVGSKIETNYLLPF